jgi:DGQHR domain-containing protein
MSSGIKKVWIEQNYQDFDYRPEDRIDFEFGKCLCLPKNLVPKNPHINNLSEDDVILHLQQGKFMSSASLVASSEHKEVTIGGDVFIVVKLKNLININNPLIIKDEILIDDYFDLLNEINDTSDVFFNKSLNYKRKAYITPCSKHLLSLFYNLYKQNTGNILNHINKNMIYDMSNDDLLEDLKQNKEKVHLANISIGSSEGDFIKKHNSNVKELANSFTKLGFDLIEPLISMGQGDIDLVLGHEKTLIVIEFKGGRKNLKPGYKTFIGNQNKHISFLFDEFQLTKGKFDKIVFLFIASNVNNEELQKTHKALLKEGSISDEPKVISERNISYEILPSKTFHKSAIKEYFNIARSVDGSYAKRDFLKDLNIFPENTDNLEVPCVRSKIDSSTSGYLYLFSCSARVLSKFASVSRRKFGSTSYKEYQRLVDGSRLNNIGKYIEQGNSFPNNIIIKFENNSTSFRPIKLKKGNIHQGAEKVELGILSVNASYNSCWVIDGQHRLFSYLKIDDDDIDDTIHVSGLASISPEVEARMFLDINDKGKPVNKDLIWDLTGSLDPGTPEGIVSNAVKKFVNEPHENNIFHDNIKVPSLVTKAKFSFGGFCRTLHDDCNITKEKVRRKTEINDIQSEKLIRNPFYSQNYTSMTLNVFKGFNSFFANLNSRLTEDKRNAIYNDAVVAIFSQLAMEYFKFHKKRTIVENEKTNFFDCIANFINKKSNEEISFIKKQSNTQQKSLQLAEFTRVIKEEYDPEFGIIPKPQLVTDVEIFCNIAFPNFVNQVLLNEDSDFNVAIEVIKDPNVIDKYRREGKQDGRAKSDDKLYRLLELNKHLVHKVVRAENLGGLPTKKIFNDIFINQSNGFSNGAMLTGLFSEITKYRNATSGHWTEGAKDKFHQDKITIVKGALKQFNSLMENWYSENT